MAQMENSALFHDKEASLAAQNHINEMPLKDDPFIQLFEYGHGATKQGY